MEQRWSFPEVIDSTMLNDLRSCPHLFYLSYIRNLGHPSLSVHLRAGGAYAKGLETARRLFMAGTEPELANGLGLMELIGSYGDYVPDESKRNKSLEMTCRAYSSYMDNWPLASDKMSILTIHDKAAVEFSFALPLPINHPDTGNAILLAGRADCLVNYRSLVLVLDDKTTSYFTSDWSDKWKLRAQFMTYTYAARQFGIKAAGCLVRGTAFKLSGIEHLETIILVHDWQLDRWYNQTLRDVERAIKLYKDGYFDYNFGESCNAFGGCMFKQLCSVQDEEAWIKPLGYGERNWNPLHKGDD